MKYVSRKENYSEESIDNARIAAWHATYNAAVTGLFAGPDSETYDVMEYAKQIADNTHGKID